ncbi:MAG TPA: gas vesicle protein [Candidatus Limnocylindrales bacterium]|nr:gas vesicle protein [Candidatus Limnocylindrales bacterium]
MSAGKDSDTHGSGLVRTSAKRPESGREVSKKAEPESTTHRPSGLSTADVAGAGLRQIAELTGKEVLGVTSIKAIEDGWIVEVEAIEDRRIPSSSDLLAVYEAQLATDGALLGYRRRKRYARGWGDKGDAS